MAPILSRVSSNFGFGKKTAGSSGPSFLPFLVNGYQDLTVTQEPSVVNWTVPADIGKIQIRMYGADGGSQDNGTPGGGGGYIDVQFEVTPGEIFTFARTAGVAGNLNRPPYGANNSTAVAFWLYNGTTSITQGNLWAIVGGGGSRPSQSAGYADHASGGRGGGNTGESVICTNFAAPYVNNDQVVHTGGSQSSGGTWQSITVPSGQIGNWNGNGDSYRNYSTSTGAFGSTGVNRYFSTQGQAIYGGTGGCANINGEGGGQGGSGWYGGSGGSRTSIGWQQWSNGADNPGYTGVSRDNAFGGGGSSRIQIPAARNPVTNTNQMGRTGGPNLPTDVRVIY